MSIRSLGQLPRRARSLLPALLAGTIASIVLGQAAAGAEPPAPAAATASNRLTSATVEQCQTATAESERSATLGGEMATVPGAARMQMRIDLMERIPGEPRFHPVAGPGIGTWLSSSTNVKTYRYLRQVTGLSAPAFYRGDVRFRWLNSRGHVMRSGELLTPVCEQPLNPASVKKPKVTSTLSPGT